MASNNKSITLKNSSNGTFTLSTSFNENSTSIANNTSNITVSGTIARGTGRFDTSYNNMLRVYWHDNKNNTDIFIAEKAVQDLYNSGASGMASGTINVEHNSDGNLSGYALATWTKVSTAGAVPASSSVSTDWTPLTYIPRQASITSAPDFNDEGNPTVNYSNPAGTAASQLVLGIYDTKGSVAYANYRDVSKTGTSYTFNLTDDERTKLRQACTGNSMQVNFYLRTTIGGTYYYSVATKTMTIVNGNPTFDNFNFADVNEKTVALTGDNTSLVRGYSNVKVTIPSSMKATANKEATLSKYRASIGTANPTDITYSSDGDVDGMVYNADSSTINVYAIDSRNNSKLVSKQATSFIYYSGITKGNISVTRTNGVSEDVTLKINGTFNKIDFGTVINSIKYSKYRYRVKGTSEWSDYKDLSLTTSGNNFAYDGLIKGDTETLGFDIGNSYEVEVLVKDELSEVTFSEILGSGIPNIALAKNGVGIMSAYDEEVGGLLQIGNNQVVESSTNSNGSYVKFYDGTMICYGKKSKNIAVANSWGSLYSSGNGNFILDNFPVAFTEIPNVQLYVQSTWAAFVTLDQNNLVTKTSPGGVQIMRGTACDTIEFTVYYTAVGKWK